MEQTNSHDQGSRDAQDRQVGAGDVISWAEFSQHLAQRRKEVMQFWFRPPGLLPLLMVFENHWVQADTTVFCGPPSELTHDWGKELWNKWADKIAENGGSIAFAFLGAGMIGDDALPLEIVIFAYTYVFNDGKLDTEKLVTSLKSLALPGTEQIPWEGEDDESVLDCFNRLPWNATTPELPIDALRKYVCYPWIGVSMPKNVPLIPGKGSSYKMAGSNIVDIADNMSRLVFICRLEEKGLSFWDCIDNCYPPPSESLPHLVPNLGAVAYWFILDDDHQLFLDLVEFFKHVAHIPTDNHYYLLAWWAMHTYLQEHFNTSPILVFYAVPERGKSRIGRALASVTFRGIETETLREANLFRWSQDLGATIFLDVKDIWKKAERNQSEDVLLKRFERGGKVGRVLYPERGAFKDTRYFEIFGPTIIATNEPVHLILDTRCIVVNMPEAPDASKFLTDITPELGLPLRERLVAFRSRHMNDILPYFPKVPLGRFGDITQPLGQIMKLVSPELEGNFRELLRYLWERRMEDKARSPEARVVLAIERVVKVQEAEGSLTVDLAGVQEVELAKVVETLNNPVNFGPVRVGKMVKALGFEKRRKAAGQSILIDQELLQRLKVKYGLEIPDIWEGEIESGEVDISPNLEFEPELNEQNRRTNHCWNCKQGLDSDIDQKCPACGWMICSQCGACASGCERRAGDEVNS